MKKVMVFGTFDLLHPGHLNLFKQARKLGDYLVVVVARDKTVIKVKKRKPRFRQRQRLAAIRKTQLADKVILGHLKNHYQRIIEEKPDIIALGYDQQNFTQALERKFPAIRIVRLKPYQPEIYKSSIITKAQKHENIKARRINKLFLCFCVLMF